ncbi:hypothetical protein HDV57DRAFT_247764 [Trichoderma longibrachiatum]
MYREPSVLCMRWEHSHCLLSGPIKALNPSRIAGWTSICSMRLTKKTSKLLSPRFFFRTSLSTGSPSLHRRSPHSAVSFWHLSVFVSFSSAFSLKDSARRFLAQNIASCLPVASDRHTRFQPFLCTDTVCSSRFLSSLPLQLIAVQLLLLMPFLGQRPAVFT